MGYHIFLARLETFKTCIERGLYGGIESHGSPKAEQMNSEVIAGFAGVRPGDFAFFYVRNVGLHGLWKVTSEPFFDGTPIWHDPDQSFPYRVCLTPIVRAFDKPVSLSDILDLRDKGRVWTFDLATFVRKSHNPITTEEGKELLRLLLRNNPIYAPAPSVPNPYEAPRLEPLPIRLDCDSRGHLLYEGYLNAWFMRSFAQGKLKDVVGDYGDFVNHVPTSFNKVMDIFLTHITEIDGVPILHKFTCMELKTGTVTLEDLNQSVMYENWLIRKLANGDPEMVQSILVGFNFEDEVLHYRNKRKDIEAKTIRLLEYRVDKPANTLKLYER